MQPEIKSKKKKKKKIRGADNRPNCKTPLSCDTMVNAKTELSSHDAGNSFYAETIFVGAKKLKRNLPSFPQPQFPKKKTKMNVRAAVKLLISFSIFCFWSTIQKPNMEKLEAWYAMGRIFGCGTASNDVNFGTMSCPKVMKAPRFPI